jgi:hypothetical protein
MARRSWPAQPLPLSCQAEMQVLDEMVHLWAVWKQQQQQQQHQGVTDDLCVEPRLIAHGGQANTVGPVESFLCTQSAAVPPALMCTAGLAAGTH